MLNRDDLGFGRDNVERVLKICRIDASESEVLALMGYLQMNSLGNIYHARVYMEREMEWRNWEQVLQELGCPKTAYRGNPEPDPERRRSLVNRLWLKQRWRESSHYQASSMN